MKIKNLSYLAMLLVLTGQFSHASSKGKKGVLHGGQSHQSLQSVSSTAAVAPPTVDLNEYVARVNQEKSELMGPVIDFVTSIPQEIENSSENIVSKMLEVVTKQFTESDQLIHGILRRLNDCHNVVKKKEQEIDVLSKEKVQLTCTAGQQDAKIAELNEKIKTAESELKQFKKQIIDLTAEKGALEEKLAAIEKEKNNLEERIQRFEEEKDKLSQEKETAQQKREEELKKVNEAVKNALEAMKKLKENNFVFQSE